MGVIIVAAVAAGGTTSVIEYISAGVLTLTPVSVDVSSTRFSSNSGGFHCPSGLLWIGFREEIVWGLAGDGMGRHFPWNVAERGPG